VTESFNVIIQSLSDDNADDDDDDGEGGSKDESVRGDDSELRMCWVWLVAVVWTEMVSAGAVDATATVHQTPHVRYTVLSTHHDHHCDISLHL